MKLECWRGRSLIGFGAERVWESRAAINTHITLTSHKSRADLTILSMVAPVNVAF